MATAQSEAVVLKLIAGLFNGSPGGGVLEELATAVDNGLPVYNPGGDDLGKILTGSDAFKEIVPESATTEEKVEVLLRNFGLEPSAEEGSPAAFAAEYFTARIEAGDNLANIAYEAIVFLEQDDLPEEFAPYADLFTNKVRVATIHSDNYGRIDSVEEGQSLFEGVTTTFPTTNEEARQHVDSIVGEPVEPEPTELGLALAALQAAQLAADNFLKDVVDNETFLSQFDEGKQEDLLEAGTATEADIGAAYDKSTNTLGREVADRLDNVPDATAFVNAGQNTREGLITDATAAAQKKVDDQATLASEAEAELATGVKGALTTAETARVALEEAYAAVATASAAQTEEIAVFNTVNTGETYSLNEAEDQFTDSTGGIVATKDATGQWTLGAAAEGLNRTADLLADLQAKSDADGAEVEAEGALAAAVLQVVRLENGDNTIEVEDLPDGIVNVDDPANIKFDFAAPTTGESEFNAPKAQAYRDEVVELTRTQEEQTELADAIAAYRETGEIVDNYDGLIAARDDARAAIEDPQAEGGLGVTLFDLDGPITAVDEDAELFLFTSGKGAEITNFGEDDQIFFGSNYTAVALGEDQTINDRVGDANTLEVFWQVDGDNLNLYVEQHPVSGSAAGDTEIDTITLVGVTDVTFQGGFVSLAAIGG